jgi:hypothetical protein
MKGRPNLWRRTATLERRRPVVHRFRTDWNLDAFSDEDLEAMMPLAEKRAAAAPGEPEWTPEEIALLTRLWHKANGAEGVAS